MCVHFNSTATEPSFNNLNMDTIGFFEVGLGKSKCWLIGPGPSHTSYR